jgi:hypothetical protein
MAKAKAVVVTTEELERVAVESAADFIADELSKEDRPKLGVTPPPPKKKSKSAEMKEKAAEEERKRKEEREERERKHKEMEPVRNLAASPRRSCTVVVGTLERSSVRSWRRKRRRPGKRPRSTCTPPSVREQTLWTGTTVHVIRWIRRLCAGA